MKRVLMAALATAFIASSLAQADDDKKTKNKKEGNQKKTVRIVVRKKSDNDKDGGKAKAKTVVRGIFVGPDGKKHEFRLDGTGNAKRYGLSKEDYERVEKALKAAKGGKRAKADVRVEIGKGIFIGKDGKKHEFSFGNGVSKEEALKKLPKEVRQQIERAHKHRGKAGFTFQTIGKGIFIGPDGKKHEFDFHNKSGDAFQKLPKKVREQIQKELGGLGGLGGKREFELNSIGKAVVIGPDGKKREFNLGGAQLDDKALQNLPKDLRRAVQRILTNAANPKSKKSKKRRGKGGKSDSDKLDLILRRLDKLEGQIRELRDKVDNK